MPPAPEVLGPVLSSLDLMGIAVFAVTGAIAAAARKQTFVTAAFFAVVTGLGGGTIRDLLIGAPVWWVNHPFVAALCIGVAVMIWVTPSRWWSDRVFDWLDALGLAAYAVYGSAKAISFGIPPFPAAMMGVLTACAGGIIRDTLAGEPSILMRPELYVTAAALSAALYVLLILAGMPPFAGAVVAAAGGFSLRAAAIVWKIKLPAYSRD